MHDFKPPLEKQLDPLREPFAAFTRAQATASTFLLVALLAALILANSTHAEVLTGLQHYTVGVVIGSRTVEWSLLHFVNDGLIAVFFFVIGLEVKRELIAGELQDRRRVWLLLCAALGGMLMPASLYLGVNLVGDGGVVGGWGIPMATDTALAIGVLTALAARVPRSVVAFLVGVAIIDDIGAILVIALFYTEQLNPTAIGAAVVLLGLLLTFNNSGFRHPLLYACVGIALWSTIVQSGIHASIAGVIVATTVPARPRIEPAQMKRKVRSAVGSVDDTAPHRQVLADADTHQQIAEVERVAQDATTPLRRWENGLELPVGLLILPLFAFLNAGVAVDLESLQALTADPVALGVLVGLVVGKPLGLMIGVRLGEWAGLATRPDGLSNRRLLGVGMLAGVGFTMSTFIAHLALESAAALASAKLAIVIASALAAIAGYLMLRSAGSQRGSEKPPDRAAR